ncbi:MAG: hypothetical protein HY744_30835 [Deltaproteobacteria bacterium]|nr:hypothetical protein [Deltaproteobacteria bacterium]
MVHDVAADGYGNVILAGTSRGEIDFGGGPCDAAGYEDIIVAKLGPGGEHIWSRCLGDAGNQEAGAVAADGPGNVFLAGAFDAVDFGAGPLPSADSVQDAYVVKLDPGGKLVWSRVFGGKGQQVAYCVALDAAGNVVVTGCFSGDIDLGDGAVSNSGAGSTDAFLVKLAPDGEPLWNHVFIGWCSGSWGRPVAVDPAGSAVLAGQFSGTVDFGGGPLVSTPGDPASDICVARFAP